MGQPRTNPIAEINSTRILKIIWPDETCTFVNELYSNGTLTIKYMLKENNGPKTENRYELDSFDTEIGVVKNITFKLISNGGGPQSINPSNPSA